MASGRTEAEELMCKICPKVVLVRLVLVLHLPLGSRLQNSWTVHEPPRIMPFNS